MTKPTCSHQPLLAKDGNPIGLEVKSNCDNGLFYFALVCRNCHVLYFAPREIERLTEIENGDPDEHHS